MRSSVPILIVLIAPWLNSACGTVAQQRTGREDGVLIAEVGREDSTIASRFTPPDGSSRVAVPVNSFGTYLRQLSLKSKNAQVHLYNGEPKARQDVHAAVVDLSVGDKDLQQCADAVMRLRAEFLFANGRQDEITFNFTSGFKAEWARWRKGERINVQGNTARWVSGSPPDASHEQLLRYLTMVFTYAGTASLQRELDRSTPVDRSAADMWIGDVFIQGGSPGHAVIVMDVARYADGRTAFMLAQSYMPAQEIHVLRNLRQPELGAWFILEGDDALNTPEWRFSCGGRRCWPEAP